MTRFFAECFGPSGKPKLRFATAREATAYRRLNRHVSNQLKAYECPTCGHWHLGRPKKAS